MKNRVVYSIIVIITIFGVILWNIQYSFDGVSFTSAIPSIYNKTNKNHLMITKSPNNNYVKFIEESRKTGNITEYVTSEMKFIFTTGKTILSHRKTNSQLSQTTSKTTEARKLTKKIQETNTTTQQTTKSRKNTERTNKRSKMLTTTSPSEIDLKLKYFHKRMTDDQLVKMLQLLDVFMMQLDKYNITYFAYGGTLLGIHRHHGIIPWDDDVGNIYFSLSKVFIIFQLL